MKFFLSGSRKYFARFFCQEMAESTGTDDRPGGRHLKPPNRKKHEEDLEKLHVIVREKEEELKSLDVWPREKIQTEISKLHAEREQRFRRRQSVDGDLRTISDDIRKQESELTKVQLTLQYKTEHKTNEAIQRLETQLKTRNFRLSEEKKIVAEIDALKRSTKDLALYLSLKKQIDEKRDQQRKLRDERDRLQKTVTEIKTKEEGIRQENQLKWEKSQLIKSEAEDLRRKIRDAQSAFSAQEREYRQQKESLKRSKQAEEDRRALEEAFKQEKEEFKCYPGPFAKEIFLCTTLIRHLQRFTAAEEEPTEKATSDVLGASHETKLDLLNESLKGEGIYLLRHKSDAEDLQSARQNGRMRKSKKRVPSLKKHKHIVHTPEIIDQFSQLQLKAPASAAEVAESVKQLREKLSSYERSSKDSFCLDPQNSPPDNSIQLSIFPHGHYKESMPSSANSCSESAISGSMPTTPDVQFEASSRPLLQTSEHARRQSWDSGTGDVEEHALENAPTESCALLNCNDILSSGSPPLPSFQHLATSTVFGALCNGESSDKLQALIADSTSGESEVG